MSLAQKKMVSMGFMVAALIAAIAIKGETLGKLWFVLIMIGLILNVVWLRCPRKIFGSALQCMRQGN